MERKNLRFVKKNIILFTTIITFISCDFAEYILINIDVNVNIAELFKDPNTWNIQTHNQQLEDYYNAQIMMFENGQDIFSLGEIYRD